MSSTVSHSMPKYYEMKDRLQCWENQHDENNTAISGYYLNKNYWMPPGMNRCTNQALGSTCSFYGPKDVPRTTQESFLQGRGQVNSDQCPDCDVIYLPESVFASTQNEKKVSENLSLQPQYTRQPKSCFTLSETDTTTYAFMPGAWQKGYTGFNGGLLGYGCDTNIQSREQSRSYEPSSSQKQFPGGGHARGSKNYGSYQRTAAPSYY